MFVGAWGERLNKQETTDPPRGGIIKFSKHVGTLALLANYSHYYKTLFYYQERKIIMIPTYTSVDQLPLTLCAEHVAMALGISRAGAYTLLHSKGFPTIKIGKRLVVPRDKFIKWMEAQAGKTK